MVDDETLEDGWGVSWAAHQERQFTWGLEASPSQRLAWLEEALRFADRAGVLRPPGEPEDLR